MREIKFRAYLKEEDIMLYSEHDMDDTLLEMWIIGGEGVTVEVQEEVWREGGGETYSEIHYVKADAEIMQYTGLKDINGKDIYEGDILEYEGITSNGNPVIRKVIYNIERCQFMAEMYQIECPSMVKSTIIGNIHQNPELL